ncbi:helix-turn-helix domain-containing protein [Streptomyces sp. AHU1]
MRARMIESSRSGLRVPAVATELGRSQRTVHGVLRTSRHVVRPCEPCLAS